MNLNASGNVNGNVYYNEWDRFASTWLTSLIDVNALPFGYVDDQSIAEVVPVELERYDQCHFFAGIGGWAHALSLAAWPANRPVWTGSCPCQPYSVAGKRKGVEDDRNVWPEFFRLIGECRPATVFGEQVASKDGRLWLDGVFTDLESVGYAVAGADLCAAGVGAPHIRQRLYWVAYSTELRRGGGRVDNGSDQKSSGAEEAKRRELRGATTPCSVTGWVANSIGERLERRQVESARQELATAERSGGISGLGNSKYAQRRAKYAIEPKTHGRDGSGRSGDTGGLAQSYGRISSDSNVQRSGEHRQQQEDGDAGAWSNFDILPCADSKSRRVESGTFPLAHGIPNRMGKLRGYGNAIVPQVAAEFVRAFMETEA